MSDSALPHTPPPLELDRVQSSRAQPGEIRLRLSGRWVDADAAVSEDEELLVVNVGGRRHRFPVSRDEEQDFKLAPGRWSASFTVPTWAQPREPGQAALWLGSAVISVPPLQQSVTEAPSPTRAGDDPDAVVARPHLRPVGGPPDGPRSGPVQAPRSGPVEAPRSGPLADLLLKEKVAEASASRHGLLESTLAELRSELDELRVAVQEQRREMREQSAEAAALRGDLATANVSREAAVSEAAGLRSELERIVSELAVTREQRGTEAGDLREASRLLADARALAQELRSTGAEGWDSQVIDP